MNINYSALPRQPFVELQSYSGNGNTSSPDLLHRSIDKMFHVDIDGPFDLKDAKRLDDEGDSNDTSADDFDIDNYPLIKGGGVSKGSGVSGAVFNLTTTIIGAGIMALPATMKVLGLPLGFVLIILIGILSEFSVELLVRLAVFSKAITYGEVVQFALGRPARIFSEICIIVNNGGTLVVYLIILGDVMSGSVHHTGVFDQWLGTGIWDHRKLLILIVLVVFLAPLCSLSKIDSLSLTSAASVALAVVFVVVASAIALIKFIEGRIDTPRMAPDFGSKKAILDLLVVIPIMTNAFVCHFNVQPIYNELEGRSPQKMNLVGRVTTILCITVYVFTALSGYLLFGEDTESDVLTNFDKDLGIRFSSSLNYIVRVGYVFHLVLVFPVVHFSLRQTVDALAFEGSAPLAESRKRCLALTAVLLVLIYFGSTVIPNIWTAFKFTGATAAVSLGFIFPSLVALRLARQGAVLGLVEKFLSWLMLILAIIVGIVGVIGNVYSINGRP